MSIVSPTAYGRTLRVKQDQLFRASRRFSLYITVKGLSVEVARMQSRSAQRCHEEGQRIEAAGTLTVTDQFWHLIPDAPVLGYRVFDHRTLLEVPLASASPASDIADDEERGYLEFTFGEMDTAYLRTWIAASRKSGGEWNEYDTASLEIAERELAGRIDEPVVAKRLSLVERLRAA